MIGQRFQMATTVTVAAGLLLLVTPCVAFGNRFRPLRALRSTLFGHFHQFGGQFGGGGDEFFNAEELRQRIAGQKEQEKNSFYDLFYGAVDDDGEEPEDVHIILFNPDTDDEGVHTIEFPKGSGNNLILAFESQQDCDKFAAILKQQQFFDPTPQEIKLQYLQSYCESLGVLVQVVPKGMDIRPPKDNVDVLGHNPNLKKDQSYLEHLFQMDAVEGLDYLTNEDVDDISSSLPEEPEEFGAWQ